jgi:hypothetical protein
MGGGGGGGEKQKFKISLFVIIIYDYVLYIIINVLFIIIPYRLRDQVFWDKGLCRLVSVSRRFENRVTFVLPMNLKTT